MVGLAIFLWQRSGACLATAASAVRCVASETEQEEHMGSRPRTWCPTSWSVVLERSLIEVLHSDCPSLPCEGHALQRLHVKDRHGVGLVVGEHTETVPMMEGQQVLPVVHVLDQEAIADDHGSKDHAVTGDEISAWLQQPMPDFDGLLLVQDEVAVGIAEKQDGISVLRENRHGMRNELHGFVWNHSWLQLACVLDSSITRGYLGFDSKDSRKPLHPTKVGMLHNGLKEQAMHQSHITRNAFCLRSRVSHRYKKYVPETKARTSLGVLLVVGGRFGLF